MFVRERIRAVSSNMEVIDLKGVGQAGLNESVFSVPSNFYHLSPLFRAFVHCNFQASECNVHNLRGLPTGFTQSRRVSNLCGAPATLYVLETWTFLKHTWRQRGDEGISEACVRNMCTRQFVTKPSRKEWQSKLTMTWKKAQTLHWTMGFCIHLWPWSFQTFHFASSSTSSSQKKQPLQTRFSSRVLEALRVYIPSKLCAQKRTAKHGD